MKDDTVDELETYRQLDGSQVVQEMRASFQVVQGKGREKS